MDLFMGSSSLRRNRRLSVSAVPGLADTISDAGEKIHAMRTIERDLYVAIRWILEILRRRHRLFLRLTHDSL